MLEALTRGLTRWPALTSALVLVAFAWTPVARAVPVMPSAPTYGWLFDDGSGTTAAASHGGHDASLQNGTAFTTDTPFAYGSNHALSFDGTDDFADVSTLDNLALTGQTAFTLSLWVRADATPVDRAFWSGAPTSTADTFGGRYDQRGWLNGNSGTTHLIKFGLMIDGTNYQYESSGGYQQNTWQHILFTWESGSGARLYVDGVLDTPSETSLDGVGGALSDQTVFLIGDGAKANWAGEIDEVMVWRRALSGDNAEWLASNSAAALPIPEPGTAVLVGLGLVGLGICARRAPGSERLVRWWW